MEDLHLFRVHFDHEYDMTECVVLYASDVLDAIQQMLIIEYGGIWIAVKMQEPDGKGFTHFCLNKESYEKYGLRYEGKRRFRVEQIKPNRGFVYRGYY